MLDRPGHLIAQSTKQVPIPAAALLTLMTAAGAAWPQGAAPPPALGVQEQQTQPAGPPLAEPAPSPAREENPGLLNEIGKIFDKLPSLKTSQQPTEDLNSRAKDAAKDATDTLSRP